LFQDITVEELLELKEKWELTLIDVRSPSEFIRATIPGSMNIPLFNDLERLEIGSLGLDTAKNRALEIASVRLPSFVKEFQILEPRVAIFCWRGGMRSKTSAVVLSLMGIRVYRLLGGIRAYRKWITNAKNRRSITNKNQSITKR
jgi:tRNA 2-selenouridine synthase